MGESGQTRDKEGGGREAPEAPKGKAPEGVPQGQHEREAGPVGGAVQAVDGTGSEQVTWITRTRR